MIQRIQSAYLFLTAVLALIFISGNIIVFTGESNRVALTLFGVIEQTQAAGSVNIDKLVPFAVLLTIIPLLSVVSIFLFRNRKVQMAFILALAVLIIIEILFLIHFTMHAVLHENAHLASWFKLVIPPVMLILAWLAYRGVRKDEELVKSYDRLR